MARDSVPVAVTKGFKGKRPLEADSDAKEALPVSDSDPETSSRSSEEADKASHAESTSSEGSTSEDEDADNTKRSTLQSETKAGDLKARLSAFLPAMQKANAELSEADGVPTRQIDDIDEDEEHYIEMNLGLGVLSERTDGDVQLSETDSEEGDDESETEPVTAGQDSNIMAKLKGEASPSAQKRKIEEVG